MTTKRPAGSDDTTNDRLLHALQDNPRATVQDLVKATALSRPTVQRHLTKLETGGRVQRHRSTGQPERWSAQLNTTDPNNRPEPADPKQGVDSSTHDVTDTEATRTGTEPRPGSTKPDPGPAQKTPADRATSTDRTTSTDQADPGDDDHPTGEPDPPQTANGTSAAALPKDAPATAPAPGGNDLHTVTSPVIPPTSTPEPGAADPESTAAPSSGALKRKGLDRGQLRARVAELLSDDASKVWKVSEISNKLQKSSGAISNALDRLVELGTARLVDEKPRSFQAVPAALEPTQSAPTQPAPPQRERTDPGRAGSDGSGA